MGVEGKGMVCVGVGGYVGGGLDIGVTVMTTMMIGK
jgi:hypothetical protein